MDKLLEMEVIGSVRKYLEKKNFIIKSTVKSTLEHGTDIVAVSPERKATVKIEAKGETSSNPKSKRYDMGFDKNQKRTHLGVALLKCLEAVDEGGTAGIALPADSYDKKLVDSIQKSLEKLGLIVFLVDEHRDVTVEVGKLPR